MIQRSVCDSSQSKVKQENALYSHHHPDNQRHMTTIDLHLPFHLMCTIVFLFITPTLKLLLMLLCMAAQAALWMAAQCSLSKHVIIPCQNYT